MVECHNIFANIGLISSSMATNAKAAEERLSLCPAVSMYGPCNIRDLTPGQTKLWCACGLSQKQPWCDGSHKGTGFLPIKWTVPEKFQTQYELCACKHTASPPLCDGSHIKVPLEVLKRQRQCANVHSDSQNLCTGCGWRPDW
ncbi:CDGSH iron-sulfur domain-containing protein 3, mitochondrial-like [Rhopilema esculentum]|uniref:CDGSH iron-sulfur domain-containing protein 3, mitochondrial-like n=1 Tax=Rhopilema esculentum TaxID=499914 RepID=UPI0031DB8384